MRSYHSLKLLVTFVSLFLVLTLWMAKAEEKTTLPADSLGKTEQSGPSASDTTDLVKTTLEDFHKILVPLWHQAFPEEDFKTIRENVPLLQEKLMTLLKVKIPTYLQENEEKLKLYLSKRQELVFHMSQVNLAVTDTVDSSLASAFEQMHWAYEELVKVFAVQIKEIDSFHQTLYFLWHKALPEKDYDAIKKTAPVLKAEADSLMKATLPFGCSVKKDIFEKRKSALKDAVYGLAEVCKKASDQKEIEEALSLVHEKFVELNLLLK